MKAKRDNWEQRGASKPSVRRMRGGSVTGPMDDVGLYLQKQVRKHIDNAFERYFIDEFHNHK